MLHSVHNRHVVLVGGRFSDNMGDQVIMACVRAVVKQSLPDIAISEIDIAGRLAYAPSNTAKAFGVELLYRSPPAVREGAMLAAWSLRLRRRCLDAWLPEFHRDGLVVVAGGHLLADFALNYPLKINALVRCAEVHNYAVVFNACGVSKRWSRLGRHLFTKALGSKNVKAVSVRDAESAADLARHVGPAMRVSIEESLDPALSLEAAFPYDACRSSPNYVGLGLAHPLELRWGADESGQFEYVDHLHFWVALVAALRVRGHKVALFTNGSQQDDEFLRDVVCQMNEQQKVGVRILERPITPTMFVEQLRLFQAIAAHRLHANVVAYALGIPSVALVWDPKVESFGELSGRSRYFLRPSAVGVEAVARLLEEAMAEGVPNEARKRLARDARRGIYRTLDLPELSPLGAGGSPHEKPLRCT